MTFYHDLITQKSWQLLQDLRKKYQFILIGGWAVFLYTHALKSKDIDLVVEFEELEKIKNELEVIKNNRLKRHEARIQEVEIDIYVPYYSSLGIPIENLRKFEKPLEGFKVIGKEALAILKQKALEGRENIPKGRKDLIDLISLFKLPDFNWTMHQKVITKYRLKSLSEKTKDIIQKTTRIEELNLNVHQMTKLKKKILPNLS